VSKFTRLRFQHVLDHLHHERDRKRFELSFAIHRIGPDAPRLKKRIADLSLRIARVEALKKGN